MENTGSSGKHSWWKIWSLVGNAGSACDHAVFSHDMYYIYNNAKGRELISEKGNDALLYLKIFSTAVNGHCRVVVF